MLRKIAFTLLCLLSFIFVWLNVMPVLHYFSQQPSFEPGWPYFLQFLRYPGGFGKYLSNLAMQCFYYNFAGSLVIIAFACLNTYFLYLILSRLELARGPLILAIPFAFSLAVFRDYYFPVETALATLFIFAAVYLFTAIRSLPSASLYIPPLLWLLIYLGFGSGAALVFAVTAVIVILLTSSSRKVLLPSAIMLITAGLLPLLFYEFIFNISLSRAFVQFLPEVPVSLAYSHSAFIWIMVFLIPVSVITARIFSLPVFRLKGLKERIGKTFQGKASLVPELAVWLITAAVLYAPQHFAEDAHRKNVILAGYYAYHEDWAKVISVAKSDPEYDLVINLEYNRAIDRTGRFLEMFFEYPQLLGTVSLHPDELASPTLAMQSSDFYYNLSYISKSQHWAYAAMTLEPRNPRILKRLVLTNIISGNYKASGTYLNVLARNFFEKDFVAKYRSYLSDTTLILKDKEITEKRRLMPHNFAVPVNIRDRLADLTVHADNRQAWEYLQVCNMLELDLGRFYASFSPSAGFYEKLPLAYEQALLMYLYSTGQKSSPVMISRQTMEQFTGFLRTLKQFNNDPAAARGALESLKDTYFYYATYLSPKVTGVHPEIINN